MTDSPDALAAFEAGRIKMRLLRLPLDTAVRSASEPVIRHGNESDEHARLKLAALLWMRSESAEDAQAEVHGVVGIADAYSAKANWIVECGNTRFGKLADAALWEDAPRFTLIPYQNADWKDGSPRRLIAVDFSWGKDLTEDLEAARWEKMRRAFKALELDTALAPSLSGRA